jgi:ketosteroid isomerase-like protein
MRDQLSISSLLGIIKPQEEPMRTSTGILAGTLLLTATPTAASWRAANEEVAVAARTPRIAAALRAADRMDRAILARNAREFSAVFAEDAVVNNPFNRIARKKDAERNLAAGLIDYSTLERSIEYAAMRGDHDVVLMGEEVLTPVGKAKFAGEKIRRRTTEIWTDVSGQWKLAIRQATIYRTK